jgi:hypothetical protein
MLPWTLGLDLGQAQDYSAAAILERSYWFHAHEAERLISSEAGAGWYRPSALRPAALEQAFVLAVRRPEGRPNVAPLAVVHAQRWPLQTRYTRIVEDVARLVGTAPLRRDLTALAVDATGVGRGVVDQFRLEGLGPSMVGQGIMAITITAGSAVTAEPWDGGLDRSLRVPKADLVATLQVLFEQRRLKVAGRLPALPTLMAELEAFRRRKTPVGNDQYLSWREGEYDDLVLAVALAAWYDELITRELALAA